MEIDDLHGEDRYKEIIAYQRRLPMSILGGGGGGKGGPQITVLPHCLRVKHGFTTSLVL